MKATKMKATEASRLANANKQRMQKNRAEKNAKARVASIEREKQKRADFYKELLSDARESIKEAVEEGKKFTDISMWPSGDTPVQGTAILEDHGYKDLIKKVERQLKKEGYKIKHELVESEHITNWESYGPDSYRYYYHAYIRISW